jgi:Domain of unknown function (DUF4826)
VAAYLHRTGVVHGAVGQVPAWEVFPVVSVWAIESARAPGWVGWWVIAGDCPTDYVSCTGDRTPRSAIEQISARWREVAEVLGRGEQHPDFLVGSADAATDLATLLAARSEILRRYASTMRLGIELIENGLYGRSYRTSWCCQPNAGRQRPLRGGQSRIVSVGSGPAAEIGSSAKLPFNPVQVATAMRVCAAFA